MIPPRVSVIIPNWNGLQHLPECLESLRSQVFRDFEIIIVDNGSEDDSVGWLAENAADVIVVTLPDNGGFSVAVNAGYRRAAGEIIVLLNNDTAAEPEWLDNLVTALDETGADSVASCIVFYDRPEIMNSAGDAFRMRPGGPSGYQRGRGDARSKHLLRRRVLGPCGGAAAYRRSFFEDVGLFDEGFFLLHEDTDINLRGLIAGKCCIYAADAVVLHKDSATIRSRPSEQMHRLSVRNQWTVIGKDSPTVLAPYFVVSFMWSALRMVLPARPSNWGRIPSLVRQWPALLMAQAGGLVRGLESRRDVWSRQRVPSREIISWLFRGAGPVE